MYQVTFSEQSMLELNKLDKLQQLEAIEPITMTPDEFGAFIKAEIVRWTAIAKARNIQLDN
jgi:tripartite-type tricarboxylate transporter receptor subunit TctC